MRACNQMLICCLMLSGCQEQTKPLAKVNTVSGKVYLGETIVNYGSVSFIDAKGKTVKSVIYPDGTYNIRQPVLGEVRVIVKTGEPPIAAAAAGKQSDPPPSFKKITIPDQYSSDESSAIKYEVTDGNHTFDIRMKPEK